MSHRERLRGAAAPARRAEARIGLQRGPTAGAETAGSAQAATAFGTVLGIPLRARAVNATGGTSDWGRCSAGHGSDRHVPGPASLVPECHDCRRRVFVFQSL